MDILLNTILLTSTGRHIRWFALANLSGLFYLPVPTGGTVTNEEQLYFNGFLWKIRKFHMGAGSFLPKACQLCMRVAMEVDAKYGLWLCGELAQGPAAL